MSVQKLAQNIAETVDKKGAAYGNAIDFVEKTLTELYPNGIPVAAYKDALITVRVLDKLKRLATDPNAFGESPWEDIVGYALRGAEKARAGKNAPGTYKPWKKLELINPSPFSRNVPFYVAADCEYDPTVYREVKKESIKLDIKGFWAFDKGGVHDLTGINPVARGNPDLAPKSGFALALEQEQALNKLYEISQDKSKSYSDRLNASHTLLKYGMISAPFEITDEDVDMAVDVLVELLRERDLDISLFSEIHLTLMEQGWDYDALSDVFAVAGNNDQG